MKKLFLLLLICLFVVSGVLPLYGASPTTITLTVGNTSALVNGGAIQLDVAPFIKDGRTFVPLRFVSEQLGAEVTYDTKPDGSVNTITVKMGGESSAPNTSGIGTVGQKVIVEGAAVTVVLVTKHYKFGDFDRAKDGSVYLNVEAIVENISRETLFCNPYEFSVKDSDSYEYDYAGSSVESGLKSSDLLPGEKARGNFAFEVPVTAHGFMLKFEISGADESIRIDLGL